MAFAVALGFAAAHLSVDLPVVAPVLELVPILLAVAYFYRRWRPDPWISIGAESCAQVALILFLGALLTYLLATTGFPYRDAELHAADRLMGLDWRAYLHFVNSHPLLCILSRAAYGSMAVQYAFTIAALIATSRFVRVQQYQAALTIALIVSIAVFALVPAVGTYAFFNVPPESYDALDPILTFKQMQHLEAMRTHSWSAIHELEGLISFPSFHTASGLLFVWALYPIRRLRWWIVVLNVALIAAAPLQGAHYFIDIIAGVVVALVAVGIVMLASGRDYASSLAPAPVGAARPARAG